MTPAPLMALVREWRNKEFCPYCKCYCDERIKERANELEAALKAWAEQLDGDWHDFEIVKHVLGVEEK